MNKQDFSCAKCRLGKISYNQLKNKEWRYRNFFMAASIYLFFPILHNSVWFLLKRYTFMQKYCKKNPAVKKNHVRICSDFQKTS